MNILADIALTMVPNCGPKTIKNLLDNFCSTENIFKATRSQLLETEGVGHDMARFIEAKASFAAAEKEIKYLAQNGIKAIAVDSDLYPSRLRESIDRPHVIYVKGDTDFNTKHYLAVVGTRNITSYGERVCQTIIRELAELVPDVVIVSGLALGTDILAHKTAMRNDLKTVGVMGRNLDSIYPAAHTNWANYMVAEGGALVSEYNSTQSPDKSSFVQRNRIIAGMCDAVLVVESAAKGGSLHTARMAFRENRDVFAVPGRIGDKYSEGTNAIINNNVARLVCSAQDIVMAMMWRRADQARPIQADMFASQVETMSEKAQLVYKNIGYDPTDGDEVAVKCGMDQAEFSSAIFELELGGAIRAVSGNRYARL